MTTSLLNGLTEGRYLVLHGIVTLPDALLNRGSDGTPKSLVWGGTTRHRVSPQAYNRAMRTWIRERLQDLGLNTTRASRLFPGEVAKELIQRGHEPAHASLVAAAAIAGAGFKMSAKNPAATQTTQVVPIAAVARFADAAEQHWDVLLEAAQAHLEPAYEKNVGGTPDEDNTKALELGVGAALQKILRGAFDKVGEIDLALFGRFVAEYSPATMDSSVHTAHAFSVGMARTTNDFYTLVDDIGQAAGITGAAITGYQHFTSGTLYRHVYLDRRSLRDNLARGLPENEVNEAAQLAEKLLVEAFVHAVPAARSTRSGSDMLPALVLAVASDEPVNGAAAFQQALEDTDDVDTIAAERLADYLTRAWKVSPIVAGRILWLPGTFAPQPDFGSEVEAA